MDIRNSLDGLKSLLGVMQPAPSAPQAKSNTGASGSALGKRSGDLQQRGQRSLPYTPPSRACARTRWPAFRQR